MFLINFNPLFFSSIYYISIKKAFTIFDDINDSWCVWNQLCIKCSREIILECFVLRGEIYSLAIERITRAVQPISLFVWHRNVGSDPADGVRYRLSSNLFSFILTREESTWNQWVIRARVAPFGAWRGYFEKIYRPKGSADSRLPGAFRKLGCQNLRRRRERTIGNDHPVTMRNYEVCVTYKFLKKSRCIVFPKDFFKDNL